MKKNKTYSWLYTIITLFFAGSTICLLNIEAVPSWNTALTDSVTSSAVLAASALGLQFLLRSYPTHVGLQLYAIAISILFTIAASFADIYLLKGLLHRNADYQECLSLSYWPRSFVYYIAMNWVAYVISMQKKNDSLEESFTRNRDAATLLKEAELYKLHQQLQPHFLYNSLNSINALIYIDAEKAQDMIGKLSSFLRSSVKKETNKLIPLTEEIEYIQNYLAIESIRFGDRLKTVIDMPQESSASLPPFLLQPIMENAIRFGLYGNTGNVVITITIEEVAAAINITITNPTDGASSASKGTGFGLNGIKRRLYLLYARTDLLETEQKEAIFITRLKIPKLQHVQSDTDR